MRFPIPGQAKADMLLPLPLTIDLGLEKAGRSVSDSAVKPREPSDANCFATCFAMFCHVSLSLCRCRAVAGVKTRLPAWWQEMLRVLRETPNQEGYSWRLHTISYVPTFAPLNA